MNKKNLLRMADYIETLPQAAFNMYYYREDVRDTKTNKCNSVGCVIGHCTILDRTAKPRFRDGSIDFETWSGRFTEIGTFTSDWLYLFSPNWEIGDNTPEGAAKRIRYFVENGLPDNWKAQIWGNSPLSYLEVPGIEVTKHR